MALGLFSKALPKSGSWMEWVKRAMGVLLLGVSFYYGHLIWKQVQAPVVAGFDESKIHQSEVPWTPLTEDSLKAALGKKPIMIDFWAVWCAACHELEQNTFSDPSIRPRLENFTLLKFDATQVTPETQKWMEKFSIRGLPAVIFYSAEGVWLEDLTLNEYEEPALFKIRLEKVQKHDSRSPQ